MAVSLNSVIGFNPTGNYQAIARTNTGVISLKIPSSISTPGAVGLKQQSIERTRSRFYALATNGDNIATETSEKDNKTIQGPYSDNGSSAEALPIEDTGSPPSQVDSTNLNSEKTKRTSLTARERLRAARVLSRYNESKPSKKPELGSKLIEALQESEKGKKRPSLPQAPTNLFDDSKRGMPKEGWTISLPGGMDVFFIVLSFVLISTVMFATTYIVWKVGAIHFNEY